MLGVTFDTTAYRKAAEQAVENFRKVCPDASFAIGECLNADPFELSLALIRYGFSVPEIYGTITVENFTYIRSLAKISPETKVFSNMEPTMIYYDPAKSGVNRQSEKMPVIIIRIVHMSCGTGKNSHMDMQE